MKTKTVYFIGAGPGDPELLTLKGRKLLDQAEVIVYAGSLVNKKLLDGTTAQLHDSAGMTLEEIVKVLRDAVLCGKLAVRLHSGDTSIFSAVSEQAAELEKDGIQCRMIPGVSSLGAGAAALGQELTIPEVSQSVIITRMAGRTPVPDTESIKSFAAHRATMAIFLSVDMIEVLAQELIEGGYSKSTPAAVVEKASRPDERVIRGTLSTIAKKIQEAGVRKTAIVYVGNALKASEKGLRKKSKLYDKGFKHGSRK